MHGGVTFTGNFGENKDLYWIGFDCGHAGDLIPGLYKDCPEVAELMDSTFNVYRTFGYVREQVKSLVKQLKDIDKPEVRDAILTTNCI